MPAQKVEGDEMRLSECERNEKEIKDSKNELAMLIGDLEGLRERKMRVIERVRNKEVLYEEKKDGWMEAKNEYCRLKEELAEIEKETEREKTTGRDIHGEIEAYLAYLQQLQHYHSGLHAFIDDKKRQFEGRKVQDVGVIKKKEEILMKRVLENGSGINKAYNKYNTVSNNNINNNNKQLKNKIINDSKDENEIFTKINSRDANKTQQVDVTSATTTTTQSINELYYHDNNSNKNKVFSANTTITETFSHSSTSNNISTTSTIPTTTTTTSITSQFFNPTTATTTTTTTNSTTTTSTTATTSVLSFFSARPFNSSTSSHHHSIQPSFFRPAFNYDKNKSTREHNDDNDNISDNNYIKNNDDIKTEDEVSTNDNISDNNYIKNNDDIKTEDEVSTNDNMIKVDEDDDNNDNDSNDGEDGESNDESNDDGDVDGDVEIHDRNILIFNTLLNRNFLASSINDDVVKEINNKRNNRNNNNGYFRRYTGGGMWDGGKKRGSFKQPQNKSEIFHKRWSGGRGGVNSKSINNLLPNKPEWSDVIGRKIYFDVVTLFYEACREGDCGVLQELLDQGLHEKDIQVEANTTPLHICVFAGNYSALELLLKRGFDANKIDVDGWTPLHCAATCNDIKMCQLLISCAACVLARSLEIYELASELCDEMHVGCDVTRQFLKGVEEDLGVVNNGVVYGMGGNGEGEGGRLVFKDNERMVVVEKGEELWMCVVEGRRGLVPCHLLTLNPSIQPTISH